jgi:hypothetical protein
VAGVPDAIPKSAGAVTMPIFNVVDDSDTTQESLANVVGSVFGVKTGFYGNLRSMIQGLRMKEVLEVRLWLVERHNTCWDMPFQDINELHMEQWGQIIQKSTPPVVDTPLSPYMELNILEEHGFAMDGGKLKRVRCSYSLPLVLLIATPLGQCLWIRCQVLNFQHRYPQLNEEAVREFINWCRQEGIWPESDLYVD